MLHPIKNTACVRYYYMPARNGNSAEIIEVLNSQQCTIDVPVWEEDIILEPFYMRTITSKEEQTSNGAEIWKLFYDWKKLYADHQKYGVEKADMILLESFRSRLSLSADLSENMVP